LVAKEQKIGQLEKGLKELRKVEGELQGRVGALVKENDRLRESVQLSE
jgi:regulator of replication initiation timing